MKVSVHLVGGGEVKTFESRSDGEIVQSVVTDNGDLVIEHYHCGDPFSVHHTLAAFSAGTWKYVEKD